MHTTDRGGRWQNRGRIREVGLGGWHAGYVAIHQKDLAVDTRNTSTAPMSRYISVSALRVYTFLDAPPPIEEDLNPVPDPSAKVVKFRDLAK